MEHGLPLDSPFTMRIMSTSSSGIFSRGKPFPCAELTIRALPTAKAAMPSDADPGWLLMRSSTEDGSEPGAEAMAKKPGFPSAKILACA